MTYWALTSCATDASALPQFLGKGGRTLIQIKTSRGVDIQAFSVAEEETEYLIPAASRFKVKAAVDLGGNLKMVQLEDHPKVPSLLSS